MKTLKQTFVKSKQFVIVFLITTAALAVFFIVSLISLNLNYSKTNSEKIDIIFSQVKNNIYNEYKKNLEEVKIIADNLAITENNTDAEKMIKQLLLKQRQIKGILLYKGNTSAFDNENIKTEIDSISKKFLTAYIKKGIKIYKTGDFSNFMLNKEEIISKINNDQIIISEPFKDINEKQAVYLFTATAPIKKKEKITGFISLNFIIENNTFFPDYLKSYGYNFLLLSQNKNIISGNINDYNTGKNILSLTGEDNVVFNTVSSGKHKNVSRNTTITFDDTNSKFQLLTYFKNTSILKKSIIAHLVIIIILLIIIYLLIRNIFIKASLPVLKLKKVSKNISKGIPEKINNSVLNTEYKEIGENLNKISKRYKNIEKISADIIQNKDFQHLPEKSSKDLLARAVNSLIDFIKEQKERQKTKEEDTSRQLWMRKGRFEISEAERISSKNTEELSYNLIRAVVNYVDALMGGIYFYDKETENIELLGAYAYEKDRHFHVNFKPGEGIVGACVVEKKKILLDHIPEDYIKIATGLGTGTPSFIAVIPVFFKNEINAVIEVAFLNKPEEYKIEFIEQLSDNIGAWIDASVIRKKTEELLTISQEQTKKLAEKEEELNKKVAELQEIQEKTDEINKRYRSILNAVNQSIMTVEYTPDGTITDCNKKYTEIMGFESEEIKGKNVSELVKDQSESWKKIIEEVKTGKIIKKEVTRYTKDGREKRLTATYTPYYNREGKITQILFFAFDITNINIQ